MVPALTNVGTRNTYKTLCMSRFCFALSWRFAVRFVVLSAFTCRQLRAIFQTKPCAIGIRRREQECRRFGRDDDEAETICLTYLDHSYEKQRMLMCRTASI